MRKKICMLGAFAVGKTSLVSRYVRSIYQDTYLSTVGVKIDKKTLTVDGQEIVLVLWDVAGEDEFFQIPTSYLRGTSGYLLVVDGTRRATLDQALDIHERTRRAVGEVPCLVLVNKVDLAADWELSDKDLGGVSARGLDVLLTSAKTGALVDEAFATLARRSLGLKP